MDTKKQLLEMLMPKAVLEALTPEAIDAIPQGFQYKGTIIIRSFPFRIGRESRVQMVKGTLERIERPKLDNREPNNDLYLIDRGQLLNISREHAALEKTENGYLLRDRGSACGTKINDEPVGGNDQGGSKMLQDGDIITLGVKDSPYRYRFVDFSQFGIA